MKRYVFNGDFLRRNIIGVGRYSYEILKALDIILKSEQYQETRFELAIPKDAHEKPSFENINVVLLRKHHKLWIQTDFYLYVKKNRAIPINLDGNPSLFCPGITCKHDVTHLINPKVYISGQWRKAILYYWHRLVDYSLIHSKSIILTVSNTSKSDILRLYKCDECRVVVIPNAWQHIERIEPDYLVFRKHPEIKRGEYFFCLGAQNYNKNFKWILDNAKNNPSYCFVVAGLAGKGNKFASIYNEYGNVIFLGYITDGEMKALMQESRAFVFPSLYEGFGIPPLEALSLGKDVIVSNTSCLPEIYEDSAYYIDPKNSSINLYELLESEDILIENKEKILNKYSWKESAQQLLDLLQNSKLEKI
ncbi:MAG: glycosyltransferase family 4 protein [Lachnospiraceae bacterium]|nr:glycosyltransferase family 4 protein [Lachnospiraceae bacterium]